VLAEQRTREDVFAGEKVEIELVHGRTRAQDETPPAAEPILQNPVAAHKPPVFQVLPAVVNRSD
jgi:hypothetical protein